MKVILTAAFIISLLFANAQSATYVSKQYMDQEYSEDAEWKDGYYLFYFYQLKRDFKITIHKMDSVSGETKILAEIVLYKRAKEESVRINKKWHTQYIYKSKSEDEFFEVRSYHRLDKLCIGKPKEAELIITADINGIPFYQVFRCEKLIETKESRTFDEM